MTREEKIKQMKEEVYQKEQEIWNLRNKIGEEIISDFYERNDLKEGQPFSYCGKKCIGIEIAADPNCLKAIPLTAKGDISKRGMIIYNEKAIKPM